jgi:hypothetical protein
VIRRLQLSSPFPITPDHDDAQANRPPDCIFSSSELQLLSSPIRIITHDNPQILVIIA